MEKLTSTIARLAFVFKARLADAGRVTLSGSHTSTHKPNVPLAFGWLLLTPMHVPPDYVLYQLEPASLAEAISEGDVPLAELMGRLENGSPGPSEFAERWRQPVHCQRCDRVSDGAFFALQGSLRYALRVLNDCPLIYLNEHGKAARLDFIQEVTRLDTGHRLSRDAYAALRPRLAKMPIPALRHAGGGEQASPVQSQRPSQRPSPPSMSSVTRPNSDREVSAGVDKRPASSTPKSTRIGGVGRGIPQPPGGPRPRGRFMPGRPMSQRYEGPPRGPG